MRSLKLSQFSALECIQFYYVVSLFGVFYLLNSYTHTNYSSVASTQVYLFQWIPDGADLNAALSFICAPLMVLFLFMTVLISYQWVRILWFILFFLIDGFVFSYVLGHQFHMYVWLNLIFALIPGNLDKSKNDLLLMPFIKAAQIQIFIIYAIAGIWKILAVVESFRNNNIAAGFDYVPYSIAWEIINSNKPQAASLWIMNSPVTCFILGLLVLAAQAGSLFVLFFPRLYFLWGLVLSVFHIGTLITVNVFFKWSIPPIIIFLCLYRTRSSSRGSPQGSIRETSI